MLLWGSEPPKAKAKRRAKRSYQATKSRFATDAVYAEHRREYHRGWQRREYENSAVHRAKAVESNRRWREKLRAAGRPVGPIAYVNRCGTCGRLGHNRRTCRKGRV